MHADSLPSPVQDGSLAEQCDVLFAPGSPLEAELPQWTVRDGQRALALGVAQAVEDRAILMAEAGTGTGKTLAYLVPALLHGGRVIISTATRNLQDQLFGKDLPAARRALGAAVSACVLKGRSNYVCLYRLQRAGEWVHGRHGHAELRRIAVFAKSDVRGDLSALAGLEENSALTPLVTSTADNCLGADCPDFKDCFVMKARREALAADVVIINHHLFFADLALRGEGVAELLPTADTLILDEAHQLAEIGVQFLGARCGTAQVVDLARDVLAAGLQHAKGLVDWQTLSAQLERSARDLRLVAPQTPGRLGQPQAVALPGWDVSVHDLQQQLDHTAQVLEAHTEASPEFDRLEQRCAQLRQAFESWGEDSPDQSDEAEQQAAPQVRWADVGTAHLRLQSAPLSIAGAFAALVAQRSQAWIFTSATLTVGGSFRHARNALGLTPEQGGCAAVEHGVAPRCRELRVASPFDYAAQARLLVPQDLPLPNQPGHSEAVGALAAVLAASNSGGTFVLTTTLRAAKLIAQRLRQLLPGRTVLEQFDESKAALLARFATSPQAVLVGSQSFWEGVDLPGDRLTLVIIDKLPFAPPDDPLTAARLKQIEAQGRSGFSEYSMPQAALSLQQGAGRLIRTETDRGVLVVCDRRLTATGWGRQLLAGLPAFTRVTDAAQAKAFLQKIQADA
ncbi:putative ATP-dependent helicase DinG [mine drainage metagenome]|uniref:Putative ATP-dependent helicase DinG n=1 Tax=mine drainage metagenome TaxID=410659 RepID=A0A1J5Q1J7_9ZZZZ